MSASVCSTNEIGVETETYCSCESTVLFVDSHAGNGDGHSWASALTTLDEALCQLDFHPFVREIMIATASKRDEGDDDTILLPEGVVLRMVDRPLNGLDHYRIDAASGPR